MTYKNSEPAPVGTVSNVKPSEVFTLPAFKTFGFAKTMDRIIPTIHTAVNVKAVVEIRGDMLVV